MNDQTRKIITGILIVVSIVMIVFGIFNGEVFDVFNKAIKVCLQCMGIG